MNNYQIIRSSIITINIILFSTPIFAQLSVGEIVESVAKSVVTIETNNATGSGVILDSSGIIVTNFHVIEGESEAIIRLANGDEFTDIAVVDIDTVKDIALLKIKIFDESVSPFGNSNSLNIGDDVVIIGSPRGFQQSVTTGIVSAIRDSGDGYKLIQTDAAISPGSSGGGMYNSEGELVGIVVSKLVDAENINFVIPINYVRGMYSTETKFSLSEVSNQVERTGSILSNVENNQDAELGELLSSTNLDFSEHSDGFWFFDHEIEGYVDRVAVYASDEMIITVSYPELNIAELSIDDLKSILSDNYQMNYAKVGIDADDIIVLNELPKKLFIPEHYEDIVDSVANLSLLIELKKELTENTGDLSTKNPLTFSNNRGLEIFTFLDGNAQIAFNSNDWEIDNSSVSEDTGFAKEYGFVHKSEPLWFKIIAEKSELSYEILLDVLIENASSGGLEQAELTRKGMREVNGLQLQWVNMNGSYQGSKVAFYYHLYTGQKGTVQLAAFTTSNLIEEYESIIDDLVSSFRLIENN